MLEGQVAIVTGAGRGIGRGCALALARAGADVLLISRTLSELSDTAAQVDALECGCAASVVCDITDSRAIQEAIGSLERVDILVHAAGGNIPEPFLDVSEKHLDALLSLNVKGAFLVAQAAARVMLARKHGGAIVFLSSQMGHVGAPRRTVYCATKHAIEGLTKALALELAAHQIRVNAVAPTFVDTPMTRPYFEDVGFRSDVLSRIPLGRIGDVDDVAEAVLFLVSPASSFVTGTSLLVDGGWTAQ